MGSAGALLTSRLPSQPGFEMSKLIPVAKSMELRHFILMMVIFVFLGKGQRSKLSGSLICHCQKLRQMDLLEHVPEQAARTANANEQSNRE